MSDYLSDLAARSLVRTEVILPRLASRFEPAPGAGALGRARASLPDDPAAGMEGPSEVRTSRQEPLATAPTATEITEGSEVQPGAASALLSVRSTSSVATPLPGRGFETVTFLRAGAGHLPEPIAPHAESSRAESLQPPRSQAAPVLRQSRPGDLVEPARPLIRTRSLPDDQDLAGRIRSAVGDALAERGRSSAPAAAAAAAGRGWQPERAAASRGVTPEPHPGTPASEVPPARVIAQPQATIALRRGDRPVAPTGPSRVPAGEGTSLRGGAPEPAPTIQVTIGRIEVRATPAPTAGTASKSRSAPVLSLDDYLRQRNGGGR